ncbi:hypothetical protein GKC56_01530 [Neisseriaceae bacterium PsAf]|nr:hypothetical protein [Neisseriaceae bacterium PsAf]
MTRFTVNSYLAKFVWPLVVCHLGFATNIQDETSEISYLKNSVDQCLSKNNNQACESLVSDLADLCEKNNSVACLELARIGVLGVQASIDQNVGQSALQWLNITLGATKRSCALDNQEA